MYYLQSRYYDPAIGRFINGDSYASSGQGFIGCNMFGYCGNNPINNVDFDGCAYEYVIQQGILYFLPLVAAGSIGFIVTGAAVIVLIDLAINQGGTFNSAKKTHQGNASPEKVAGSNGQEKTGQSAPPVVTKDSPPTESDGYIAPKGGPKKGKTSDGKTGWVDRNGNIWVPAPTGSKSAHGGGHWDVQNPHGNGYTNVYPGGKTRPGSGKPPKLPPPNAYTK